MKTTCFQFPEAWPKNKPRTPQSGVALIQDGVDRFTVKYGVQVKAGLSYNEAATELGACLMHCLACDGQLDNREKGEQ